MSLSFDGLYRFDEFELDPTRRLLSRGGVPVSVSPKAFEVLHYLVANAGRVVTKEELLRSVWPDSFVEESNLPQYVHNLRKILTDRASFIATIPGRGYQFATNVETMSAVGTAAIVELPLPAVQAEPESGSIAVTETAAQAAPVRRQAFARWALWAAAVVAAAALVAAYLAIRQGRATEVHITAYTKITHDGRPKSFGGADGSRVYFRWEDTGGIAEVSVSGGAVVPLQVALQDPRIGEVSPDGSTLLVTSEGGGKGPADSLWSLQLLGGSLRRLGNAVSATWSPDGEMIAYGTANGDICVMRRDGTEAHRIASAGGYLKSVAWSPDGGAIRFSRDGLLWEISSDGAKLHQLLPGWGKSPSQWSGKWAPDGRFFFVGDGQIWLLDKRQGLGGNFPAQPVQLTFGPTVWDRPMPSLDGKKILASGQTKRGELVHFDAGSRQFQPFLAGISAEFVTFSSDGKSVAYVSYPEGVLWRANPDGSSPMQLTEPPVYPKSVRWSPDGSQIAFVDRTEQGTDAIYVVTSDGNGKPRRLFPEDRQAETDPSWSPDGGKVAFSTSPNVGASAKSDLRILDLATGKADKIPDSDGLLVPHWSPDGRMIAAMTLDTMGMKLFNLLSNGGWTKLDTGAVAFPEWSHDGRSIYYMRWTPDPAILRIRTADGKRESVADLKGVQYTGVYTSWMGLDPADTPLMLRDVGTDDIYSLMLETEKRH